MSLICVRPWNQCLVALAGSLVFLAGSLGLAQEAVPFEKRLPPGVQAFLSVTDVSQFKSQFHQTGYGQLLQDKALAPFLDQFSPRLEELSGELEQITGASLEELLNLVSGEFSVAFIRSREKGIGAVGLVDVGSRKDLLASLLAKLDTQLTENGAERSTSSYAGSEMTTWTFPAEEPGAKPMAFTYLTRDSYLVVGTSTGLLEQVLDRWDGSSSQTFSTDTTYQYVMQRCQEKESSAPVILWYMTPVELTLTGMSLSPQTAMPAAIATGMLPALGLNKFKAYGGSVHLATDSHDYLSLAVMCVDSPPNGLLNLFQFPASIQAPPAWVPESAASYTGLHWDLQMAYTGAKQLIDSYLGPGSTDRSVKQLAEDPSGPGIHIKNDLIDQLSGIIHFYSAVVGEEAPKAQYAVSVGVNDAAKIQEVIQKALDQIGNSGEYQTQEVAGTTAYLPPDGSPTKVAIAVKDTQLVVASSVPVLEEVLTGKSSTTPLASSADYQKTAGFLPASSSLLMFSNFGQAMKAGYESARAGSIDALTEGEVDFSLLPPFEAISKYLLPSSSYMVPTERGALGVQFTPKYAP